MGLEHEWAKYLETLPLEELRRRQDVLRMQQVALAKMDHAGVEHAYEQMETLDKALFLAIYRKELCK